MDIRELRLGNYAIIGNKLVKVGCIDGCSNCITADIIGTDEGVVHYVNKFTPIPITEELLLKCGFYFDDMYKAYTIDGFVPCIAKNTGAQGTWSVNVSGDRYREEYDNKLYLNVESEYILSYTPIESLHQLQNLYFALTGNELEVNL